MRMLSKFLIILMLTVVSSGAKSASFDEAKAANARKDYATAIQLWRELAKQGDPRALFALGIYYQQGRGVKKDEGEAVRWFLRAARQGHEGSQHALFYAYLNGQGVPKDYAEAEQWIRPLAEKGFGDPQMELGILCAHNKNFVDAYKWLTLAKGKKALSQDGATLLNFLHKNMSVADIAKAERLASEWRPQSMQTKQ